MSDIEKLREIFLSPDLDDEIIAENLEEINNFEKKLREVSDFKSWAEHPVTKKIREQAKNTYVDHSLLLARSRDLTDSARQSLWAKQDAMLWLLSLVNPNYIVEKNAIEMEIKRKLESA